MAAWIIEKDSDVRQYWARLRNRSAVERAAFEQAELLLSEKPHPLDNSPGVIKHLKGGFHCNYEYRALPNAQRIFYKIWTWKEIENGLLKKLSGLPKTTEPESEEQLGVLIFFYAGPHPR